MVIVLKGNVACRILNKCVWFLHLVAIALAFSGCDARENVVIRVDTDALPVDGQFKWVWWAERAESGLDANVAITDFSTGERTDGFFVSGKVGKGNFVFRSTNDSVGVDREMRCSESECVFLMYFNNDGELQWKKMIDAGTLPIPLGSASDKSVIFASCKTENGETVDTGSVCHLEAIDANETRTVKNSTFGSGQHQIAAIDVLSDASFVVTGFFIGELTAGEAVTDNYNEAVKSGFVAYYKASGDLVWAKVFGQNGEAAGVDVDASKTGGVVVVGTYRKEATWNGLEAGSVELDNNGGTDIFVAKYDLAGNFIWANNIGGTKDDFAVSVELLDDDSVLTGSQISDFALAEVYDYYVNPFTCPRTNASPGTCHLLVKFSPDGDYLYGQSGGGGETTLKGVAANKWTGTSVVSATFVFYARFEENEEEPLLVGKFEVNDNIYLAGYSDTVNFSWVRTITSLNQCIGGPIASTRAGGFLVSGTVVGEAFLSDFSSDEPLFGRKDHTSFFIARFN